MCGRKEFKKVINMGKNPLVNSLIEKGDLDKTESVFPLVVEQCQSCWLVQIVNPIDSHEIYRSVDYLYFSGDMPGLDKYFLDYAMEARQFVQHFESEGESLAWVFPDPVRPGVGVVGVMLFSV